MNGVWIRTSAGERATRRIYDPNSNRNRGTNLRKLPKKFFYNGRAMKWGGGVGPAIMGKRTFFTFFSDGH